jgi:hypothetical protein
MEITEIILEYLKVLLWPMFAVFFVLTFKSSITDLIKKISELQFGGDKGLRLKLETVGKMLEKVSPAASTSNVPPGFLFSLPDDDFLFLDKIANDKIKEVYLPSNGKDYKAFVSLSEYGVFEKKSMSEFKPTKIGVELLEQIQKL